MKWKTVKHYDQKTHHINREEQSWFGREKNGQYQKKNICHFERKIGSIEACWESVQLSLWSQLVASRARKFGRNICDWFISPLGRILFNLEEGRERIFFLSFFLYFWFPVFKSFSLLCVGLGVDGWVED